MTLGLPCKYGDPTCPCQDGDMCHYEGPNPMTPYYSEWYPRDVKPTRRGFYQTTHVKAIGLGWGYLYWNGTVWEKLADYADYRKVETMVWRGLANKPTEKDRVNL